MDQHDDTKYSPRSIVQRLEQFEQRLEALELRVTALAEAGALSDRAGIIVVNCLRNLTHELRNNGVLP